MYARAGVSLEGNGKFTEMKPRRGARGSSALETTPIRM
jgi:hypothetical protein